MTRSQILTAMLLLSTGGPAAGPAVTVAAEEPLALSAVDSLRLEAVLEKTIFQVDVIALDLWLGPATVGEVRRLCAASDPGEDPDDFLAAAVAASRDARSRMVLQRDVGAEHRRALLGSLVAPGGGFTDQLLDHLRRQVRAP